MSVNDVYTDKLQVGDGTSEDSVMAVYGGSYFANTIVIDGSTSVRNIFESANVNSSTLTGNVNIDVLSGSVYYFTQPAASSWTFNLRGNANTSIDSIMSVRQSLSVALGCTQGAQAYITNSILVDGTYVYPKWQGGSAPIAGNAQSVDMYYFTIIKTASRQYTSFASLTRFA